MMISELIADLQSMVAVHGDGEIFVVIKPEVAMPRKIVDAGCIDDNGNYAVYIDAITK